MWGSTSAERNENFIKWSRGWFCCFIHKNSSEIPSKNPINKFKDQAFAISQPEALIHELLIKQSLYSTYSAINKNGEGGIRTHEGVTPTRFRVVRDQPDSDQHNKSRHRQAFDPKVNQSRSNRCDILTWIPPSPTSQRKSRHPMMDRGHRNQSHIYVWEEYRSEIHRITWAFPETTAKDSSLTKVDEQPRGEPNRTCDKNEVLTDFESCAINGDSASTFA